MKGHERRVPELCIELGFSSFFLLLFTFLVLHAIVVRAVWRSPDLVRAVRSHGLGVPGSHEFLKVDPELFGGCESLRGVLLFLDTWTQ